MKKTGEKDIYKIATIGLAVLILITIILGVLALVFSGSGGQGRSNDHEKIQLETIMPSGEYELKNHIAVKSDGSASSAVSDEIMSGEYIIPDSSTRALTDADVEGMSAEQLRYARNEIYARHGRMFKDAALQEYFNSKSWYAGTISADSFSENLLSEVEKRNIDFLKSVENSR